MRSRWPDLLWGLGILAALVWFAVLLIQAVGR